MLVEFLYSVVIKPPIMLLDLIVYKFDQVLINYSYIIVVKNEFILSPRINQI